MVGFGRGVVGVVAGVAAVGVLAVGPAPLSHVRRVPVGRSADARPWAPAPVEWIPRLPRASRFVRRRPFQWPVAVGHVARSATRTVHRHLSAHRQGTGASRIGSARSAGSRYGRTHVVSHVVSHVVVRHYYNYGSPKAYAESQVGPAQFNCLLSLWNRESGWNPHAYNPSGAYGIPQALPGSKMASAGSDWQWDPITQVRWGLMYIRSTYGSPCNALAHSNATGWY